MRLTRSLLLAVPAIFLQSCQDTAPEVKENASATSEAAAPKEEAEPAGRLVRSYAGTMAPTVTFRNPEGETVSLTDFRGKPLLVNLWATWCAPCITEMPTLDALAARKDAPFQVLAVSQDMGGAEKVDAFFEKQRFSALQPYVDSEMELSAQLKAESLPTTILYDSTGREVWRFVGIQDWKGEAAARLLAEAGT